MRNGKRTSTDKGEGKGTGKGIDKGKGDFGSGARVRVRVLRRVRIRGKGPQPCRQYQLRRCWLVNPISFPYHLAPESIVYHCKQCGI